MTNKLKVFAVQVMPAGIPLKHPVMTAAVSMSEAAKILRVSRYHLARHPFPTLGKADIERALSCPGQRLVVLEAAK